jgi:hypothetical protein
LFENTISVFRTNAKPATFRNDASIPLTLAIAELAKAAFRAHGLMSNWLAPAEPARSGFPANATVDQVVTAAIINESFFIFC